MADNGGPAFPMVLPDGRDRNSYGVAEGMSLRDWFAGMALTHVGTLGGPHPDDVARWAYDLADEMLRARGETT